MVDFEYFQGTVGFLAEAKGWQLSEKAMSILYTKVCELVDEDSLAKVADLILNSDGYSRPDSLIQEVKACRRQQVSAQPALPPAAPQPSVCPEMDKFVRLTQQIQSRDLYKNCPYGGCQVGEIGKSKCQCVADSFAEALPDGWEDTARSRINPVAAALGGVPEPDPKEGDVVWA